jgi:hypothetical protein
MRLVVHSGLGVVDLNYMWLPTWLGMNAIVKRDLTSRLEAQLKGRPITEEELDRMNTEVINALVEMHPAIEGLRDYLDGIKFVTLAGSWNDAAHR